MKWFIICVLCFAGGFLAGSVLIIVDTIKNHESDLTQFILLHQEDDENDEAEADL